MSDVAQTNAQATSPEMALHALGLRCTVEARGNLAIVIPAPAERALEDPVIRQAALDALRRCGFTHAAIEVLDECDLASTPDAARA